MPDLSFLEKMGIQLSEDELKTPTYNPETMETNVKGLFLAGVVCGGMQTHKWFIENSRIHANMIVDYITSNKCLPRISLICTKQIGLKAELHQFDCISTIFF